MLCISKGYEYTSDGMKQYIAISIKQDNNIYLPTFKEGIMYKGMELNKAYSLEELGL